VSDDLEEGVVVGGSLRGESIPEQPGYLHVRVMRSSDGRAVGWRVRAATLGGLPIIELHATEAEVVTILTPIPGQLALKKSPGPVWFYGARGDEVGFAGGRVLALMAEPGAVLDARRGVSARADT